jgi:arylsulfatase A-like enzyme
MRPISDGRVDLLLLSCTVLAPLAPGCRPAPTGPAERPDVILVSIDSLRSDHLGCYGYRKETSPAIDGLASRGVRFETAVSTTSWTLPAHAAMLTGLFDTSHGVVDNGLGLPEDVRTLAEDLRSAGYRTAGFFGGPYLDPAYGFGKGFDHYESCMSPEVADAHRDVTGPRTVAAVKAWLDGACSAGDARPLFLFVHLWDVHYDYMPPREYVERFDPGYEGTLDGSDFLRNPAVEPHMAPRDFDHLLALYDGEIRFTDENLARILDDFERRKRPSKPLVLVTADHGEEFFEHGNKGHQRSLFEEVVRVPWIVCWPGHLDAGRIVRDQVRLVDLVPTVLALAGVQGAPPMDGRDVAPLMRGETLAPRPALLDLLVDRNEVLGVRTDGTKSLVWPKADPPLVRYRYDLRLDPHEESPHVEPAEASERDLEKLVEAARALRTKPRARTVDVGAELRRRLGVLGYAGDDSARSPAPR